jgi:C_GCAxxG_C_C family probable redox protein
MKMKTDRIEKSILKFQSGSSCAQAVLSTYLPLLGISQSTAYKMGAGLGGGIGGKQYICGALNAGVIVLSTKYGNETVVDSDQKEVSVRLARKLVEEFEQKFGSAQCLEVIGFDLKSEDGKKKAAEAEISRKVCDPCVEYVCQYLEKVVVREKT